MCLPTFSDMHISHQIHWELREGITRITNSSTSGERLKFVPQSYYFRSLFNLSYQGYREREHLLGINVSWFEATEIQDMKTRITLQHLDIKVCIHPQQIGLLHLYKHLSNTVSEFLYRKTQLEIQECYE